ncbi:hypothetical protein AB4Z48_18165 [Cupriavidus sp. 2TAF22]|uniref:hypothetical protein n=1 Tax=unclassified Cupriavidus TaxID=2640874 RepID=UPI003F933928
MEQLSGQQWPRRRASGNGRRRVITAAALTAADRLKSHIDELCHRMTVADSRAVRMQLCVELKQAIAEHLALSRSTA